jgi:sigma-B regulation protein RsbQ
MVQASDPLRRNNVFLAGNADACTTMVFVHGFGTDQTAWAQVAQAFGGDYRIVLLDNGGAGKSDGDAFDRDESRYLNLRGYAADLIEIADTLNLSGAVLVGHSMGAMVAALAAIERPALFARLVLIGASPRYLDAEGYRGGFTKADWQEINLAVANNYALWADAFAPLAMDNPTRPELAQYFAESIKAIPVKRAFTILYSIFHSDYRTDLPRLKIPTLIIQSAADRAVPLEVAEYLHQHIDGSRLSVIDATGHLPHVSAPEKVISAMRNFGL